MRWLIEQTLTTLHAINKQTIIHYPKPIKRKNYKIFPKNTHTYIHKRLRPQNRPIPDLGDSRRINYILVSEYRNGLRLQVMLRRRDRCRARI